MLHNFIPKLCEQISQNFHKFLNYYLFYVKKCEFGNIIYLPKKLLAVFALRLLKI